jgi:hypothetical protein
MGRPIGEEHVEVALGSARPPRTPPNLTGRHKKQQGRESMAKRGMCCVFGDWKLEYSVSHDPLVYTEEGGLIPGGNESKTRSLSFTRQK